MTVSSQSSDPIVSPSQVIAAGAASAGAAGLTSKFGVAGTLVGAALTTMIITGGSAVLKAYLESATGTVKNVPSKLRATANRRKAGRVDETPPTLPENPGLRNNFMGRLRASLGWFSRLPIPRRRSILIKAGIAALVAFVIAMGVVTAAEKGIGNSLSCGLWSDCPQGAAPGIHVGATRGTGASSSVTLSRPQTVTNPVIDPATGNEIPQPADPAQDPAAQPADPAQDPAVDPSQTPAEPADPQQPAPSADPAPETPPAETPPAETPSDSSGGAVESAPAE